VELLVIGERSAARLALVRGDLGTAQEALQRAEALFKQEEFVNSVRWVVDTRIRMWLAQGNLAEAGAWVAQTQTTLSPQDWDPLRKWEVLLLEMAAAWPDRTGDMADRFNSVPKYVVSSTLRDVTWNNSYVITDNIAEEVAKLKAQPGEILLVQGSADLVRLLAQHHLIDEYSLHVAPLVLGKGKRLFQERDQARLQLVNTKAYKTGILTLNYEPVKQQ
jgi:dihydrofolate reductase